MNASRTCAGLLAAVLLAGCTAEHPEIDVFCAHDPAPLASLPARPTPPLAADRRAPAAPTQRP
jgi:hypothetical protein